MLELGVSRIGACPHGMRDTLPTGCEIRGLRIVLDQVAVELVCVPVSRMVSAVPCRTSHEPCRLWVPQPGSVAKLGGALKLDRHERAKPLHSVLIVRAHYVRPSAEFVVTSREEG